MHVVQINLFGYCFKVQISKNHGSKMHNMWHTGCMLTPKTLCPPNNLYVVSITLPLSAATVYAVIKHFWIQTYLLQYFYELKDYTKVPVYSMIGKIYLIRFSVEGHCVENVHLLLLKSLVKIICSHQTVYELKNGLHMRKVVLLMHWWSLSQYGITLNDVRNRHMNELVLKRHYAQNRKLFRSLINMLIRMQV